jgi:hypothetical protein
MSTKAPGLSPLEAHKQACAVIAVADACVTKAANQLQAIEQQKKANTAKAAAVFDILKKADLLDTNDAAAMQAMQSKLASHDGALDVIVDATDNLIKLSKELDERDKRASVNAPPPVQPTGGKIASLGSGATPPSGGAAPAATGDYNQQSQAVKRAQDEGYLSRIGYVKKK